MPRIIFTSRYLSQAPITQLANLVEYMGTRPGVELCPAGWPELPATEKQQALITRLRGELPDVTTLPEYAKYQLITRRMTPRIVDGFQIVQVKYDAGRRLPENFPVVEKLLAGAFVGQAGMDVDVCLLLQQLVFPGHFQCHGGLEHDQDHQAQHIQCREDLNSADFILHILVSLSAV